MERANPNRSEDGGIKLFQGLVSGILLSIPIWISIGVAAAVLYQYEPISKAQSAILLIAAAVEFVLLRRVWRAMYPRTVYRESPERARAAMSATRSSRPTQTFLLLGLVGVYLHYYFWDVQLQIASMRSVIVFVHAPALNRERSTALLDDLSAAASLERHPPIAVEHPGSSRYGAGRLNRLARSAWLPA